MSELSTSPDVPAAEPAAAAIAPGMRRAVTVFHGRQGRMAQAVIAGAALVFGIAQGVVWVILAPQKPYEVFSQGYRLIPTGDYHPFDGLALFALSGAALGIIIAVAAWRVRAIRGVTTLLTVTVASVVAAALAYGVTVVFAPGTDPTTVTDVTTPVIVWAAASIGTPLVIMVQAMTAAVTYTFLAAWDGRDDLGRTRVLVPQPDGAQPGPHPGGER